MKINIWNVFPLYMQQVAIHMQMLVCKTQPKEEIFLDFGKDISDQLDVCKITQDEWYL